MHIYLPKLINKHRKCDELSILKYNHDLIKHKSDDNVIASELVYICYYVL